MQSISPWRSAARTDTGKVRARNEDAFLDNPEQGLWVVADGMGGHQRGDLASRMIVEQLAELPLQGGYDLRVHHLRQALHRLNHRLGQELTVVPDQPQYVMGSTVAALLLDGERGACVWAGDSRCYLWRGNRLYQLTRDHSLLQRLIDEQGMSHEEAGKHPSAHALTRAVGASERLSLGVLELQVYPSDVFLLCSDGLYQSITTDLLGKAMSLASPHATLQRLFEQALEGAARDNLTAVVICQ